MNIVAFVVYSYYFKTLLLIKLCPSGLLENHNWRENMPNLMDRITVNPNQCGGRPCIRGMRIRVIDVLDLFAAGLSADQILDEMPDLEREDLQACLQFARRRLDHPLVLA